MRRLTAMVWLAALGCPIPDDDKSTTTDDSTVPDVTTEHETTTDTGPAIPRCDSMHAAGIAVAQGLASCQVPIVEVDPDGWAIRGQLTADPLDHPCRGLTANACAAHFVAHPEDLLRPVMGGGQIDHVFLDTEARCNDGSPPLAYHRPARPGDHDNDWLIYFHGTNLTCRPAVDREGGTLTSAGEVCWSEYGPGSSAETSVGAATQLRKDGILNPTHPGNPFADWNVLYLWQCSNDLSSGATTEHDVVLSGAPGQIADLATSVPFEGQQIVSDLFGTFAGPNRPPGTPGLADADTVLLVGSSGGSLFLQTHLDRLAAEVASHAPQSTVRGVVDAFTPPSTAALEAAFDGGSPCPDLFGGSCDAADFDVPHMGTDLRTSMTFDDSTFQRFDPAIPKGEHAKGWVRERFEGWNAPVDASCAAHHSAPDDVQCYDQLHVLLHHTETPVFVVDSSRDPGKLEKPPAELGVTSPDQCYATVDPTDPSVGADLYARRHTYQALSYAAFRDEVDTGAHGDSHGAGHIGVFVAEWAKHQFLPDDCRAAEMGLGPDADNTVTALQAIAHWLAGNQVVLIDGVAGIELFDTANCDDDPDPSICLSD